MDPLARVELACVIYRCWPHFVRRSSNCVHSKVRYACFQVFGWAQLQRALTLERVFVVGTFMQIQTHFGVGM